MNIFATSFVYIPDIFRGVNVALLLFLITLMPRVIGTVHTPSKRGWLFIISLEIMFAAQIGLVFNRFGHTIRWYGTPAILVSSVLMTIYALNVLKNETPGP